MSWPSTLVSYKRTDEYTADSTPAGLLSDHTTKAGVWAMIRVLEGSMQLVTEEGVEELHKKNPGFIEPEVPHHIVPGEDVRFYVEFFRDSTVA